MGFGMTVAVYAPGHRQILRLVHDFHLVDPAMAGHAANSTINMHRVIEIHKIWQPMNSCPRYRITSLPAVMQGLEFWAGRMNCSQGWSAGGFVQRTMAVDASGSGRNASVGRLFHRRVAVATIHFQLARVNLVAKRDRLNGLIPHIERLGIRGAHENGTGVCAAAKDHNTQNQQKLVYPSGEQKTIHGRKPDS